MLKRVSSVLVLTQVLAACSLLPTATTATDQTTTTAGAIPTATTLGTGNPPSTDAAGNIVEPGFFLVTDDAISVLRDELEPVVLTGDVDYALAAARSDLSGGLLFQYASPGPDVSRGILRLLPGTVEPLVLLEPEGNETVTLVGVATIGGRANVIYVLRKGGRPFGGQLLASDIQGGAPVVLYDGPDLIAGAVDENLIVLELRVNAQCNKLVAFTDGDAIWEADCEQNNGPSSVATANGVIATVINGSVSATRLDGEAPPPWTGEPANQIYDISADRIAVGTDGGFVSVTSDGTRTVYEWAEPIRSVTLFQDNVAFTDGHRLGGIRVAQGPCSATGQPSSINGSGLPEEILITRQAIVDRAIACDFDGLAELTGPSFTVSPGGGDPRRFWLASEANFGDDLSRIVRILKLPFTTTAAADGTLVYVWPSATKSRPTEADWESLRAVFNEEEIDAMRRAGSYNGLRIGIDATGTWIYAVAGD